MSTELTLKLTDDQVRRLDRQAQKNKLTRPDVATYFLELALRAAEFPDVEFRDFGAGFEAFVRGTRLRVWWVTTLVRDYDGDVSKAAEHINVLEPVIRGALAYASAFPDEVAAAIEQHDRDWKDLPAKLPNLRVFRVDLAAADAPTP